MKFKNLGLSMLTVAIVSITGCASSSNIAWKRPERVTCAQSGVSSSVVVKATDKDFHVMDGKGCFNSDNKMCDLRLYQVMVESFAHSDKGPKGYEKAWGPSVHGGNIRGIIENLDYIKSTGINTIWVSPIFETTVITDQEEVYDKLDGTGYFTSNYFKIDPKFGTLDDAKELVSKAHSKGLYVILDGVFGHAKINVEQTSPKGNKLHLNKMCRLMNGHLDKISLRRTTCFDVEKSLPFLKEFASYWIKTLKIDGWRLDQAYQLSPEQWKEISKEVQTESAKKSNAYKMKGKKVQPLGYMVAEIWSGNARDIEKAAYQNDSLMSAFNFPVRYQLTKVLASNGDVLDQQSCSQSAKVLNDEVNKMFGYSKNAMPNNFISNHDLPRYGDLIQRAAYSEDGKKTKEYFDNHQAAFSFLSAMSGPLTIYYGDEIGDELAGFVEQPLQCDKINQCDDHVSRTTGRTSNLTKDEENLKTTIASMLKLRDKHPALAKGKRVTLFTDSTLIVDLKQYNKDNVLYVFNSSKNSRKVTIDNSVWTKLDLGTCTLENLLTNESLTANEFTVNGLSGSFFNVKCTK